MNKVHSPRGAVCGTRGSDFRDDIPSRIRTVRHSSLPVEETRISHADQMLGYGSYIESAIGNLSAANVVGAGLRCSGQGKTKEGHGCDQSESHDDADWFVSIL